jgi:hypothetical protein
VNLIDLGVVFYHTEQAWQLAERLLPSQDLANPLVVVVFGRRQPYTCWVGPSTMNTSTVKSYVNLTNFDSFLSSQNRPKNREWHEYGHNFMADAFGNLFPDEAGRTNHSGYFNLSSSDSWTEAFAEFFAMSVARDIAGEAMPYIYKVATPDGGWRISMEANYTAWATVEDPNHVSQLNEELALAGLLWDLVDPANATDAVLFPNGPAGNNVFRDYLQVDAATLWGYLLKDWGNSVPKSPMAPANYGYIWDARHLYDALKSQSVGSGHGSGHAFDDLDELFIMHGVFSDTNTNRAYETGEVIGYAANGNHRGRRDLEPAQGSFIAYQGQDLSSGQPISLTGFVVQVDFAPPFDLYDYSFETPASAAGFLPVMQLPEQYAATITIWPQAPVYTATVPLTFTNAAYWQAMDALPAEHFIQHTFVMESLPTVYIPCMRR